MDLIGFWSGVTLMTWLLLAFPVFMLFMATGVMVNWSSRERVDISRKLRDVYSKIYTDSDPLHAMLWMVSAVSILIYGLFAIGFSLHDVEIKPLYQIVSDIALFLTPVMSFIGTLVIVFGGGAIIMRKVFDMFFAIQDKLDKLDKK